MIQTIALNATGTADENAEVDYWLTYLQIEDYMMRTHGRWLSHQEKLDLSALDAMLPLFWQFDFFPNYDRIFHPKYFGCLRWNSAGNETLSPTSVNSVIASQKTPGRFFISIVYVGGTSAAVNRQFSANAQGVYVFMQNASDYPLGEDRAPLILSPGFEMSIVVQMRRFYEQQPAPYTECGFGPTTTQLVNTTHGHAF